MIRILLIATILVISNLSLAFSYTVEVTEKELQKKVAAMMPLEKKKYFITMIFTNPVVDLLEGNNKIGIKLDINIKAPGGVAGKGTAKFSGSLSYNSKKAEFYLKDPLLHELVIDKVSEKMAAKVKNIAQASLAKILAKRPVYTLKDKDLKQKLAKSLSR